MAVSPRKVKNKRDANGSLTGRAGTVYDVNIKYTSPDGKKSTYSKKGFLTRKEAEGHEAEIKAKLQAPTFAATVKEQRRQTVKDYLQEWVESYARVNLRPSTYDGYKRTIANYIVPYIGNVPLNQLSGQTVDKMFQDIIDKGLKPSTAAGAKRVLSVALNHARKYHFIETNAARDTLTKFGKGDKTPDPYTPEQVRALWSAWPGRNGKCLLCWAACTVCAVPRFWGCAGVTSIWKREPLTWWNSCLSMCRRKRRSLRKWPRPSRTGGGCLSPTLRGPSLNGSLHGWTPSDGTLKRRGRPTMTTTL